MAKGLSGSFDLDTSSSLFKLRVNWSETYDASTNSSVVTVTSVQFKSTGWYGVVYYPDGVIKVNGKPVITMNSNSGTHNCYALSLNSWTTIYTSDGATASGSATVVHSADGTKSISIEVAGNRFQTCSFSASDGQSGGSGWNTTGSKTIALTAITTYTLSVSAGTGSLITVNRIASGYADTGKVTSGMRLYYGDILKITFSPSANYRLLTTKVNKTNFTSGNTHTVTGNVTVASTAQVLASAVGATNADIGSVSTITITKYNDNYYHSLYYQFGTATGYITSSGGVQPTETKFKGTSVAFTVPDEFYAQIPNAKTGTCTITCRTYETLSSTAVLGNATTCIFTVKATYENCAPIITSSVVDTNETTIALTGDASTLIRYKSTALCTINATRRHSSTISAMTIAGNAVTGTTSGDVTTATKSFTSTDKSSFEFTATDSRGYQTKQTVPATVVAYVALTCNPVISRPTPTGDKIVMTVSGNVYRGSFGAYTNTLTLRYRYKESGGSYGPWQTIDTSLLTLGASSYRATSEIELTAYPTTDENGETINPGFDYHLDYDFEVQVCDGAGEYTLSTVTATVLVQRGIPVFDWGENDFNVNVPLMLSNVNILNIIYPIGTVYMHSSSALPTEISNVGVWSSVSTGISGIYAWRRTE